MAKHDPQGWAQFGHVKMPDYRWGIFLNPGDAERQIHFGDHKGEKAWQDVPGEHRANLRRIIVTQGDTEPASVEQQRHLGLTAPGESWKAVEAGTIEMGGALPINPSGGLIGLGHPVGATGVRMALDAMKQVTGQAGDYQVEGAKTCQTLNIGGSTTTTVSLVVGL